MEYLPFLGAIGKSSSDVEESEDGELTRTDEESTGSAREAAMCSPSRATVCSPSGVSVSTGGCQCLHRYVMRSPCPVLTLMTKFNWKRTI